MAASRRAHQSMNSHSRFRCSHRLPVLLLAALAPGAHADWCREYVVVGGFHVLFLAIEASGPRLRFETQRTGGELYVSIFVGDEDLITGLMPAQRTWMHMEV